MMVADREPTKMANPDIPVSGNMQPWPDVCHQLNSLLRGWSA
jgi:hypothetical protein